MDAHPHATSPIASIAAAVRVSGMPLLPPGSCFLPLSLGEGWVAQLIGPLREPVAWEGLPAAQQKTHTGCGPSCSEVEHPCLNHAILIPYRGNPILPGQARDCCC